jgi:acyl-CoA reductase-like NAD-dependent aldehyde dehydrogenase
MSRTLPNPLTVPRRDGRWSTRSRWRPAVARGEQGGWREQLDPGTGSSFAEVLDMTTGEISRHIEVMRSEYDAGPIPTLSERRELLIQAANAIEAAAIDLGELDSLCTGKRHTDATATANAGAAILRYYAEQIAANPYSSVEPSDNPRLAQIVDRLPVGLVACILPWNFPLSQACARLAMSFASGNAGVYKGSELAQPPLLALEELVLGAGLPRWAFSVVTGGPDAGRALVEAPEIDAICFTGGVPTGAAVAASAARSLKRVILELGGKTPFVVFADADQDAALEVALKAGFNFQGQACNAGSLLLVERPAFEEFLDRIVPRVEALTLGHQLAEATEIGPMISDAQRARIHGMVAEARDRGATVRAGGRAVTELGDGFFYEPTVITDVPTVTAAATDELFGPVVVAYPFDSEEEVTKRVNESEYGLAATVWTTETDRVARMRSTLRTGQLYVNTHGHVGRNVPWGGFRLSGVGRLYGRDGLYAFTEARSTYIMA